MAFQELRRVLPSSLPGCLALQMSGARSYPRHSHDQHGIGLIERGGQRSASARGPVEARAGELITVNPGEVHDGRALDAQGRQWRMLYLEPALFASCSAALRPQLGDALLTPPVLAHAGLRAALQRLFTAMEQGAMSSALLLETLLLESLAQLLPACGAMPLHSRAAAPLEVARARERLLADPQRAPGLDELAQASGLSRYQLLRSFARAYGLPPHAYLLQHRLALARRLIAHGAGLAEAAGAAGFADQSHMHRAFVRCLGVTPGTYRAAISFKTARHPPVSI